MQTHILCKYFEQRARDVANILKPIMITRGGRRAVISSKHNLQRLNSSSTSATGITRVSRFAHVNYKYKKTQMSRTARRFLIRVRARDVPHMATAEFIRISRHFGMHARTDAAVLRLITLSCNGRFV